MFTYFPCIILLQDYPIIMESDKPQVAIFVDFENLVYGIQDPKKNNSDEEEVDIEPVVRLAEEYGRVVQAHAYADWRNRVFNQYQVDLYKLGMDIVHVMGKKGRTGFKNAVDIKMAVDTIETIFTFPDIDTYIIVSGDRDFIHVLKMLRRHGKHVVGISPARSASEDLAQLTDRFIRYESLTNTYFQEQTEGETEAIGGRLLTLQKALAEIVSNRPEGVRGAELKGLLRRNISATFDESNYGFSRFSDLIRAFPNDVTVQTSGRGGDITVLPTQSVGTAKSTKTKKDNGRIDTLIKKAGLPRYRYEINPKKRLEVLEAIYTGMDEEPFSQNDIYDQIQNQASVPELSATELSKYFLILMQSRIVWTAENSADEKLPVRARKLVLNQGITNFDAFMERFEASILYKVLEKEKATPPTTTELAQVLGLKTIATNLKYVEKLIVLIKKK